MSDYRPPGSAAGLRAGVGPTRLGSATGVPAGVVGRSTGVPTPAPSSSAIAAARAAEVAARERALLESLAAKKREAEARAKESYEDDFDEEDEEEGEEAEEAEEEEEEEEDEEEEEETESETESDEEQTLSVKLLFVASAAEGTSAVAKILDVPYGITFKEFARAVAKKCKISNASDLAVYFSDPDGDNVELDSKKVFRKVIDQNWPGENGNPSDHTLKLTVCSKADQTALGQVSNAVMSNTATSPALSSMRPGTSPSASLRKPSGTPGGGDLSSTNTGFNATALNSTLNSSSSAPSVVMPPEGVKLKWTKMNLLGRGSFGTVYEGITNDGKLIAVKQMELPAEKIQDEDDGDVKALIAEINLMAQLKHRHIVAYYGCQTTNLPNGGKLFEIFLEHCHGGSLTSLRKKFNKTTGKLSIHLARAYTKQILEGLQYLHRKGVMHRDIKSDNVLISASGDAKLADFGCSKRMGTATMESGGMSDQGGVQGALYQTMVGTPLFMAPEVMNDSGPGYGHPADIWSVGCLLIELLGRKPWNINGNNMFQIMFLIAQSKDMPNGVPKEGCPKPLWHFFERCFERDPSKRATCDELLQTEWITCDEDLPEDLPEEDLAKK